MTADANAHGGDVPEGGQGGSASGQPRLCLVIPTFDHPQITPPIKITTPSKKITHKILTKIVSYILQHNICYAKTW